VFEGREAIREWIVETMGTWPGNEMPVFPIEWYIVDDERVRLREFIDEVARVAREQL